MKFYFNVRLLPNTTIPRYKTYIIIISVIVTVSNRFKSSKMTNSNKAKILKQLTQSWFEVSLTVRLLCFSVIKLPIVTAVWNFDVFWYPPFSDKLCGPSRGSIKYHQRHRGPTTLTLDGKTNWITKTTSLLWNLK